MARIARVEIRMVSLKPKVRRTDAIQNFELQETPIVTVIDTDGATGTGFSYTIGAGGPSIVALLERTLVPRLIGHEAEEIELIWRELFFATHATTVGPITSLALAAVDIALWDLRCRRSGLPLWRMAGGAKTSVPIYTTEGGWLHIEPDALVEDALAAQEAGFSGSKIMIGRPHLNEDRARLTAVREAVGDSYEIMTDANQGFTLPEAIRRTAMLEEVGAAWFEEPMPADDIASHARLAAATRAPVAVGESLYSLSQFKDYLQSGACSVVQTDVARVGGVTPWLKIAHMAEAHNIPVSPHCLMEIHASLACAVPNGRWIEYMPQLDAIAPQGVRIEHGRAYPSHAPGIGIVWDRKAIDRQSLAPPIAICA